MYGPDVESQPNPVFRVIDDLQSCLLYTSDAADDLLCVDLGGRRIIQKKKNTTTTTDTHTTIPI